MTDMQEIAAFLKNLKFQKAFFGGVREADVWKKLELLDRKYRDAFEAQEIRFQALLEEREARIRELEQAGNADKGGGSFGKAPPKKEEASS